MALAISGRHVAGSSHKIMDTRQGMAHMSRFRKIALVPAILAIILVAQTAAALIIVG